MTKATLVLVLALVCSSCGIKVNVDVGAAASLDSWTDHGAKQQIVAFVEAAVDPKSDGFVAVPDRIAVFDNDGTLWCEKPLYFQAVQIFESIKTRAKSEPQVMENPVVKAIVEDDFATLKRTDLGDLMNAILPFGAGVSAEAMQAIAVDWTSSARHARFDRPYGQLVYQPMLELLDYLRDNDFKVFIVTGGGVDFVRGISEGTYGVPKDQVIGSSLVYGWDADAEAVTRSAKLGSIDDKAGKPPNIALHIGRRPVIVAGNSDGDLQMLQYADAGSGPSLKILVHHDDAEREYDYHHGTETALEQAQARKWTVVSIKEDFGTVFPPKGD